MSENYDLYITNSNRRKYAMKESMNQFFRNRNKKMKNRELMEKYIHNFFINKKINNKNYNKSYNKKYINSQQKPINTRINQNEIFMNNKEILSRIHSNIENRIFLTNQEKQKYIKNEYVRLKRNKENRIAQTKRMKEERRIEEERIAEEERRRIERKEQIRNELKDISLNVSEQLLFNGTPLVTTSDFHTFVTSNKFNSVYDELSNTRNNRILKGLLKQKIIEKIFTSEEKRRLLRILQMKKDEEERKRAEKAYQERYRRAQEESRRRAQEESRRRAEEERRRRAQTIETNPNLLEPQFLKNKAKLLSLSGTNRERAFRKMAIKYHPNKAQSENNKVKRENQFKVLGALIE